MIMTGKTNTVKAYISAIDIVLNFDSNVVSTSLEPSRKIRFQVLKIGTLKRTCVYCDLQAKRDECGYAI